MATLIGGGDATIEVDVGAISLGDVEIKNDAGNPVPVSGPLTDTQLRATAVPVADNAGSLTVDGKGYRSTVSITRPSNTTQYTAGDVIGIADSGTAANAGSAIHTLTTAGPSGGYILLQSAALIFSDSSVISGMAGFRVHLYSSSPTAILDNAVYDLVSGDRSAYIGYFDLPTPADLGSTIYTQVDSIGRQIKLGSASTSLFAQIETRGTYTPASGSTIELRLSAMEVGL